MADKKSTAGTGDGRARVWTCIVYPESAPEGWKDILDAQHVPFVISPLHDRDVNPTGEPKKPHWHIAYILDGKKTYEQMLAICKSVNGTIPQKVESAKGLVRYMAHLDNPEKAQYNTADIECHGGVDISDYLTATKADSRRVLKEIIQYIVDNNVLEYEDILIYAMYNNDEWFDALRTECTYVVNALCRSRQHRQEQQLAQIARNPPKKPNRTEDRTEDKKTEK